MVFRTKLCLHLLFITVFAICSSLTHTLKYLQFFYFHIPSSNKNNLYLFISYLFPKGDKMQDFIVMESSQYVYCKFNIAQWISFSDVIFYHHFRVDHRMFISLDARYIAPAPVSENRLEASGLKPFSTFFAKSKSPLFIQ